MADLIDPMNEDTYDDRVIVHGPLRSKIATNAYRKGWDKAFGHKFKIKIKRRTLWIRDLHAKLLMINMKNFIIEPSKY